MTIRLDDPRLAAAITNMVDRRVEAALAAGPVTRYGLVAAVDPGAGRCSVYLGGSTTPSPGFAYPPVFAPEVGDLVRVVVAGADRYVAANLSRGAPEDLSKVTALDAYTSGGAGNVTPIGPAYTDVPGATLTVPVVAGHRLWIYGEVFLSTTVATDRIGLELHHQGVDSAGGQFQTNRAVPNTTTAWKLACSAVRNIGNTGTMTYWLKVGRTSGTGTLALVQATVNPTALVVFDLGPMPSTRPVPPDEASVLPLPADEDPA